VHVARVDDKDFGIESNVGNVPKGSHCYIGYVFLCIRLMLYSGVNLV